MRRQTMQVGPEPLTLSDIRTPQVIRSEVVVEVVQAEELSSVYRLIFQDKCTIMCGLTKSQDIFASFQAGKSYKVQGSLNVVKRDSRYQKPPLNSDLEVWINRMDFCEEIIVDSVPPKSEESNEVSSDILDITERLSRTNLSGKKRVSLKNMIIKHVDLYRYFGCAWCTRAIHEATQSDGYSFCEKCQKRVRKKVCFVARQIVLEDENGEWISVVAYDKEATDLLGQDASNFVDDNEATDLALTLCGRRVNVDCQERVLPPSIAALRGYPAELTIKQFEIISKDDQLGPFLDCPGSEENTETLKRKIPTANGSSTISIEDCILRNRIKELECKYTIPLPPAVPGLALIINVNYYPNRRNPHRHGSIQDIQALTGLMKLLSCPVFRPKVDSSVKEGFLLNPTLEDIQTSLTQLKIQLGRKEYGSVMIFIMAHGSHGKVILPDETQFSVWTQVVYQFSDTAFPEFSGKPKLFFIETCQDLNCQTQPSEKPSTTDEVADILVVSAALPARPAYLYSSGSVFVSKLVESWKAVIESKADVHLEDIVKIAQKSMSKINISCNGIRNNHQVLDYSSILFKRLYFSNTI